MLTELTIRQLGVIESATFCPGPGLTVVTGETGAGKTMVATGLGLVCGARADSGLVRGREGTATVEARFSDVTATVLSEAESAGGQLDDDELLIVRQISSTGRNRCWLGGTAVTRAVVQELGGELVTIHGQSEQVRLALADSQRQVLDRAAGPKLACELEAYGADFEERRRVAANLDELRATAQDRAREIDMITFGLDEIDRVDPRPGEDEALRAEARRLQDADDLQALAFTAVTALAGDDDPQGAAPVLTLLSSVTRSLEQAASQDLSAQLLASAAKDLQIHAADLAGQVSSYLADLAADPTRLEWIEERLAQLSGLTRKYGHDADEVLAWAEQARLRLGQLEGSDEQIPLLEAQFAQLEDALGSRASRMSQLRAEAADSFGRRVADELTALAMPHARMEFQLSPLPKLGPWGADSISLMFTANPGAEPAPLGKIASGGELSRVRLAIEVVLADQSFGQTMVFDEVDAGIGGGVGLQIGLRLARLAQKGQVIVVTHLAQVAAFGQTHYVVTKASDGEVTASNLEQVTGEEQVRELARMMGGLDASSSALAHASELLRQTAAMLSAL
ncbi:MAG: DNA repair protein RecN [Propionibacteriaceae bacterium]|jgi:DNA repair protein RecN (Recombination protein N)|nr:DNA repair protein RecN [Propionibacteriaceae bacterium]